MEKDCVFLHQDIFINTDSEVTAFMAQRLSGLVCDIHICSLLLFICASHLCEILCALDLRQSFTVLT